MHSPALPTGSHTEVAEHEGPYLLGLNAEGWVYVGLTIFFLIAIFVAKAPKKITDALDQRIADTRRELDEAKALRAEAEKMLADAKARQAAAENDANAIIAQAEEEAAGLIAKAEVDARQLVERRGRMAEDKIAAAERGAIADVRARAASAAAAAAATLIAEGHDAGSDRALVDRTITGMSAARLN
jgi:F-type H+-transporting ATPase subunit b